ncbi:MAG: ABC transporter permease [Bacteroidetes bacterium]|nr:ABC transporter permease [Bacteroidota bacterium]
MNLPFFLSRKLKFGGTTINAKVMQRIAVGTILLSVLVMQISFAVMHGFRHEVTSIVKNFNADLVVQKLSYNSTLENSPIENFPKITQELSKQPKIIRSFALVTKPGIINTGKEIEGVVLRGINEDYDSTYFKRFILEGSFVRFAKAGTTKDIMISSYFAKRLMLKLGDRLPVYFMQDTVRVKQFVVCGIYETGMEELDTKFALCDIRHLQKVNYWSEINASSILVQTQQNTDNDAIKDDIQNLLGNEYSAFTLAEVYPQLFDWLALVDTNATIISALMLIVSCISMITVLLIVILDKTQTVGTLKALGLSNGKTIQLFWYKAARIILQGIFWGNIVFFIFAYLQSYFHLIQLPKKDYYVSAVPILINWTEVLMIDVTTLLLCNICMLLPVQIITRISTVKVLKFN